MSLVAPRCSSRQLHQQQPSSRHPSSHLHQNPYLQQPRQVSNAQQRVHSSSSSSTSSIPSSSHTFGGDRLPPTSSPSAVPITHPHHQPQHPYSHQATGHTTLSGMHHLGASPYTQLSSHASTNVLPPPRSYYVVSWVPRALPEVVQLIKDIPTEAERCLINKHFELGMLVMRRCGVQNPEEIKCLLDGFREGTTRLSSKEPPSKSLSLDETGALSGGMSSTEATAGYSNGLCCSPTVERRKLLIFFNDHRASRPWVLCPAKHCIKSARTTGKVKGRVKILQFDQRSTSVKIPKLFMDCLSDFLTRDHYVFATFCPQQKYTDHELEWFDLPERSSGPSSELGGDIIFRELVEEHDTKGAQRIWPFEDYIIFSNSQAKIVAVFKKKQPLLTLYRNQWSGMDDCSSVTTTASSMILGPFATSQSSVGSPQIHPSNGNLGVCGTRLTSCSSDGCSTPTAATNNFGASHTLSRLAHCSPDAFCVGSNETHGIPNNSSLAPLRTESSVHGIPIVHTGASHPSVVCSPDNGLPHSLVHAGPAGSTTIATTASSMSDKTVSEYHTYEQRNECQKTASSASALLQEELPSRRTRGSSRRLVSKQEFDGFKQPGDDINACRRLRSGEEESDGKVLFSSSLSPTATSSSSCSSSKGADRNARRKKKRKHQQKPRCSNRNSGCVGFRYTSGMNVSECEATTATQTQCSLPSLNSGSAPSLNSESQFYDHITRAPGVEGASPSSAVLCCRSPNETLYHPSDSTGSLPEDVSGYCLEKHPLNTSQPNETQQSSMTTFEHNGALRQDALVSVQQHQLGQQQLGSHTIHPVHTTGSMGCTGMSNVGISVVSENTCLGDSCHPLSYQAGSGAFSSNVASMPPPDLVRQAEEAELVLIKIMTRVLAHLEPIEDPSSIDLGVVYHTAATMELHTGVGGNPVLANDASLTQLHSSAPTAISMGPPEGSLGHGGPYYHGGYAAAPNNIIVRNDRACDRAGHQPTRSGYALSNSNSGPGGQRNGINGINEDINNEESHRNICNSSDNEKVRREDAVDPSPASEFEYRQQHVASVDISLKDETQNRNVTRMHSIAETPSTVSTTTTTTSSMASGTDTGHDDGCATTCFSSSVTDNAATKDLTIKSDGILVQHQQSQQQHQRVKIDLSTTSTNGGADGENKQRRKVVGFPAPTNAILYHDLVRQFLSRLAFGLDHPPLPQKRIPDTVKRVVTKIVTDTIRDINLALLTSSIRCHPEHTSRSLSGFLSSTGTLTPSLEDVSPRVPARPGGGLASPAMLTSPFTGGVSSTSTISAPFWSPPAQGINVPSSHSQGGMTLRNLDSQPTAALDGNGASGHPSSLLMAGSSGSLGGVAPPMYTSSRYDHLHHTVGLSGSTAPLSITPNDPSRLLSSHTETARLLSGGPPGCYLTNDPMMSHFLSSNLLHRGPESLLHSAMSNTAGSLVPQPTAMTATTSSDSGVSSGALFSTTSQGPLTGSSSTSSAYGNPNRLACADTSHNTASGGSYCNGIGNISHHTATTSSTSSTGGGGGAGTADEIMDIMNVPRNSTILQRDPPNGSLSRRDCSIQEDERRRLENHSSSSAFMFGSHVALPSPLLFEEYMASTAAAAAAAGAGSSEVPRTSMASGGLLAGCSSGEPPASVSADNGNSGTTGVPNESDPTFKGGGRPDRNIPGLLQHGEKLHSTGESHSSLGYSDTLGLLGYDDHRVSPEQCNNRPATSGLMIRSATGDHTAAATASSPLACTATPMVMMDTENPHPQRIMLPPQSLLNRSSRSVEVTSSSSSPEALQNSLNIVLPHDSREAAINVDRHPCVMMEGSHPSLQHAYPSAYHGLYAMHGIHGYETSSTNISSTTDCSTLLGEQSQSENTRHHTENQSIIGNDDLIERPASGHTGMSSHCSLSSYTVYGDHQCTTTTERDADGNLEHNKHITAALAEPEVPGHNQSPIRPENNARISHEISSAQNHIAAENSKSLQDHRPSDGGQPPLQGEGLTHDDSSLLLLQRRCSSGGVVDDKGGETPFFNPLSLYPPFLKEATNLGSLLPSERGSSVVSESCQQRKRTGPSSVDCSRVGDGDSSSSNVLGSDLYLHLMPSKRLALDEGPNAFCSGLHDMNYLIGDPPVSHPVLSLMHRSLGLEEDDNDMLSTVSRQSHASSSSSSLQRRSQSVKDRRRRRC